MHPGASSRAAARGAAALLLAASAAGCFRCGFGPTPICGDFFCDPGEAATCPGDCIGGGFCGDGICSFGETLANCPGDCGGGICGNGVVEPPEQCDPPDGFSCDAFCRASVACGNGVLEPGEECDPPDGVTCTAECRVLTGPPANPGAPCSSSDDCSTGGLGGLEAFCLTEEMFGHPGGFCALQGCDQTADACPPGSHCAVPDGFLTYCLPDCAPGPFGNGGCRSDTTDTHAYQCLPHLLDPFSGGCWLGCASDEGCNPCSGGFCERDTSIACLTDGDCLASPTAFGCHPSVSACHPDHAPGASAIGGPCLSDLDCPANALCAQGSTVWPGGYCTQAYCTSWAALPEFACPAGAVCPSDVGFFGGLLQLCVAPCTIDLSDPTGSAQCDAARGDDYDYLCIETSTPTMTLGKLCDSDGAPGFCFQWGALFGMDTACP